VIDAPSRDVDALLAELSLEEKLAQLVGLWLTADQGGGEVAPMQHAMLAAVAPVEDFVRHGLGQLTRPLATHPLDPAASGRQLAELQREIVDATPHRIPALTHEECLTGLQVAGATTFPCPLAWGAAWDPGLVEEMAAAIGSTLAALGIHLGLAPVLDVIRDPRWGRVEECIAEDPYLVGVIGTAYVRGLQSAGVGATLKHFAAYSGSQAGRNLAPVHAGPRELADVFLVPFEMAVREARPEAVMHSYAEVDGVPVAADRALLTGVLRDAWGFEGIVVADYFGVTFLHTLHGVATDLADAAVAALEAGVDVELPTGAAYLAPLAAAVRDGRCPEELVDEAVRRVLAHKARRGLLEADWQPPRPRSIDLDPPQHRAIARRIAEASIVLLENAGDALPLRAARTVAVVGPNADSGAALMGDYSFTNHVELPPGTPLTVAAPTILEAVRAELGPDVAIEHAMGAEVVGDDRSGFAAAASLAEAADVCIAVVGDRAGLFGRGTVGEGNDATDLDLPGVQRPLVECLLETGTPVVLVLVTGRPTVIDWAAGRAAAIVQSFFPGEEGGVAIAGVLSGRLNPAGRLTISMPHSAGAQPYSYLQAPLAGPSPVSSADPTPLFAFGHGLSYTTFDYADLDLSPASVAVDGRFDVACAITNTGDRRGVEVVQLYTRDVAASVTRPWRQLGAWARVELDAGASARVTFALCADLLAFTGRDQTRIVEPGAVEVMIGASCEDIRLRDTVELVGDVRAVGAGRALHAAVEVIPA
jgi:beta-xylosidase